MKTIMTLHEFAYRGNLSNRTYNALLDNGITSVPGLLAYSEEDLRNLAGFGKASLQNLKQALNRFVIWVVASPDPKDGRWRCVGRKQTKKEALDMASRQISKDIEAVVAPCYEGLYVWKG